MIFQNNDKLKLSSDCVFQDLDNQKIILNIDTGKYYECNEVGRVVFNYLNKKNVTYREIVNYVKDHYKRNDIEEELNSFICDLVNAKILEHKN
tara:strand:- start:190 stop:468 length:279 start_codon:yes stop_codon:yes gene_type:complete